jgi:hypothetical protein
VRRETQGRDDAHHRCEVNGVTSLASSSRVSSWIVSPMLFSLGSSHRRCSLLNHLTGDALLSLSLVPSHLCWPLLCRHTHTHTHTHTHQSLTRIPRRQTPRGFHGRSPSSTHSRLVCSTLARSSSRITQGSPIQSTASVGGTSISIPLHSFHVASVCSPVTQHGVGCLAVQTPVDGAGVGVPFATQSTS